ncbi:DUF1460 domain-containing protein [Nocardia sp. NPDC050406]|uniref:DUF1460 domain-containing protein n=1 Tax=Nocardia sp. NPDC050406 TaxID=3364318 RepID=UPI00378C5251
MPRLFARLLLALLVLAGGTAVLSPAASAVPAVTIDDATSAKIDELLAARKSGASKGELVEALSARFLGTPYGANMLVGSATQPEQLVVDFRAVDCFTYLDYVDALSRSGTREEFLATLIDTRYAGAQVDFAHRKHFFTDWAHTPRIAAADITATLTPNAVTVAKALNAKADGGLYLPGIPVVNRDITYIPSDAVDAGVIGQLRTGDYIGAYADTPGLDVTHVGIFVQTPNGPVFRNASSLAANNKVVDESFADYVRSTPGIVVLRAS